MAEFISFIKIYQKIKKTKQNYDETEICDRIINQVIVIQKKISVF